MMPDFPPDYDALDNDPAETDCPDCLGKCYVDKRLCKTCGGSGLVPNEQLSDWVQDQIREQRNKY